jgi:hypothetical protein
MRSAQKERKWALIEIQTSRKSDSDGQCGPGSLYGKCHRRESAIICRFDTAFLTLSVLNCFDANGLGVEYFSSGASHRSSVNCAE